MSVCRKDTRVKAGFLYSNCTTDNGRKSQVLEEAKNARTGKHSASIDGSGFRQMNHVTMDPKSIDYSCDGRAIANDKWK